MQHDDRRRCTPPPLTREQRRDGVRRVQKADRRLELAAASAVNVAVFIVVGPLSPFLMQRWLVLGVAAAPRARAAPLGWRRSRVSRSLVVGGGGGSGAPLRRRRGRHLSQAGSTCCACMLLTMMSANALSYRLRIHGASIRGCFEQETMIGSEDHDDAIVAAASASQHQWRA